MFLLDCLQVISLSVVIGSSSAFFSCPLVEVEACELFVDLPYSKLLAGMSTIDIP